MTVTPPEPTPDPNLVVSADEVARRAGIPRPLSADNLGIIEDAIRDAQDDVVAYLGRPIIPTVRTETGRWAWGDTWDLVGLGDDTLIEILTVVAEVEVGVPTGYYTVTYRAGIDARTDPTMGPIRRFVRLHTLNSPEVTRLWKTVTKAKGEVRSQSAEGQSVSYAAPTLAGAATTGTKPGDLTPGSLPTLGSLDFWRVAGRRVYQAPSRASDWPFSGDRW